MNSFFIYDSLFRPAARQFLAGFVKFFRAPSSGKHVAKRETEIEKLEGEPIRVCLVILYRFTDVIFKGTYSTRLHHIFYSIGNLLQRSIVRFPRLAINYVL